MEPIFTNDSCSPFELESSPCLIGDYVYYSVNATGSTDVAAGLKFAQEKNIRLVIKNTGHDFLGKSTGKGALGIWTHNLKTIDFIDYNSNNYSGRAVKMGAGVQAYEVYEAADKQGLRVVGGDCATVGLAGGFTQGGGHSPLSSVYGLGADQVLEWELVTASGGHIIASPTSHSDLYWALSGGGGGTYGVVLALTAKAYPDGPVGGASMLVPSNNISADAYWAMIGFWHSCLSPIVDAGIQVTYTITNELLTITALNAPDLSSARVENLIAPFTNYLHNNSISYTANYTTSPTFLEHFATYFGPLPYGPYIGSELIGGRMIPRTVVETNGALVTATMRNISRTPNFFIDAIALNANLAAKNGSSAPPNAVLPAWRDVLIDVILVGEWNFTIPYEEMAARKDVMTDVLVPQLEDITPGSGTYLSEADFQLRSWKRDFYGANYERLLDVKRKYDSEDLFYATTAVGSDAWVVVDDGRLCRA